MGSTCRRPPSSSMIRPARSGQSRAAPPIFTLSIWFRYPLLRAPAC